jgi:DNA-directed RNA polymerase specialized sigma24 family protein
VPRRDRNREGPAFDQDAARALLARVRSTEDPAWRELLAALWPELSQMVRASRAMAVLARSDDHVRNVVSLAVERLGKDGCRAARLAGPWCAAHPDKTLRDWLRILTTNVARDYVRDRAGRAQAREEGEPVPDKRLLMSLATLLRDDDFDRHPSALLSATSGYAAKELAQWAEAHLPKDQVAALSAWLHGASFEDIAADLKIADAAAAKRMVRAAVAALRRHASAMVDPNPSAAGAA